MTDADVVVVGCGPVGVMAALRCAQRGLPVIAVDRSEEVYPHAEGRVCHAVDAGQLMQAIAHDGDAALESGYGQRPFPQLEGDLFAEGHPLVGAGLPAAAGEVSRPTDGWLVIGTTDADVDAVWTRLGAARATVPAGTFPGLVADDHTVIVRPDRHIAAVTTDLSETTRRLAVAMALTA